MSVAGPLSGITVIDLTRVLAGPFCTMVMADLGARIIKVEVPGGGDDARHYGPFVDGKSAYFMSLNRGKESIALNLKDDDDRAIFERLVERADVLIENFRPGAMDRLGYGWDDLKERYPGLIYASASGFGHNGPYMQRPAYDIVVQGMGGIMSMTGHPGAPPARAGTSVGDITAGLFTAIGINGALVHRNRTGKGMKLDVSMLDSQVAICENAIARYLATGNIPGPQGGRNPSISPFEAYKASDGYIIIAAGNNALFQRLCHVIGRADMADDPRFGDNSLRVEHNPAIKEALESALAARTVAEWIDVLGDEGIPSGPINDIEHVVNDPQVQARNMLVRVEDPVTGSRKTTGNPIKMSAFPDPDTRAPSPELDADRENILKELEQPVPRAGHGQ